MYKVYTHTTPDGMVYVGVTCQDLKERWQKSHYKTTALQPYIDKYGWENITHQVIYTCEDKEEAYKVEDEMYWYYTEKGCCINKQRSGLVRAKNIKAYGCQYYQDHKDEKDAYNRKWRQDHKDDPEFKRQKRECNKRYYQKKKAEKLNRMTI